MKYFDFFLKPATGFFFYIVCVIIKALAKITAASVISSLFNQTNKEFSGYIQVFHITLTSVTHFSLRMADCASGLPQAAVI